VSSLTYPEAVVIGALQGITELFPVSSLGHSVLIPAVIGGSWARDLNVSAPESPYLAFIVGLHVATALALVVLFRRDWIRIVGGLFSSIRHRRISTVDERMAWLIIVATVPVGLSGLVLEHLFRTTLGKATPAAIFLTLNGCLLLAGERLRRRADDEPRPTAETDDVVDTGVSRIGLKRAFLVGLAQCLALLPGISRSGATMVAGLAQGLTHEEAVRLSFLLATPVILAAGVLKLPDLTGPLGAGIHGQVLAGSVAAFVCAYVAAKFLTRWFEARTLTPFGIYCLIAGPAALLLVNR
jgi:undecaprenyl-diphosphatase